MTNTELITPTRAQKEKIDWPELVRDSLEKWGVPQEVAKSLVPEGDLVRALAVELLLIFYGGHGTPKITKETVASWLNSCQSIPSINLPELIKQVAEEVNKLYSDPTFREEVLRRMYIEKQTVFP